VAWLRKSQLEPLTVTMSGVKLGDRLLMFGAEDAPLLAALAGKAGLTGRACVLDESEPASRRTAEAVQRDGVLVESFASPWPMTPFDADSFDVVVVRNVLKGLDAAARVRAAGEVHRVLRPGGRTIVIEDTAPRGLGAFFHRETDPMYPRSGGATHVLEAAGFRGVRTLAERDGQLFVEGIKAVNR
jgi:SAM-dependent methyltransferase